MRKNLSLAGYSLVVLGLFMGSCVSKKKYMEAQTSAAQRYQTDSTQWASQTATMQQNISSLEKKSTTYQKQMDSFKTSSMNYQKRWNNVQTAYTQQTKSTEQLHQQVHSAIDEYVEPANVESRNGKIYVNLPEKMLFASGSSALSAKGKQALDKLAAVLASNDNIEVDVITTAAYYGGGTSAANTDTRKTEAVSTADPSAEKTTEPSATAKPATANKNATAKNKATADKPSTDKPSTDKPTGEKPADSTANSSAASPTAKANVGDSAYPGSGSTTARSAQQNPKQDSSKASQTTTKARTTEKTSTADNNQNADQSVSFKSTPKAKGKSTASSSTNWNLNVARSTAIVRQLTQTGLPQARVLIAGQNAKPVTTNEWAATNRGYQIVLSPKMDSYYDMMKEGQGSTSMK